MKRLVLLLLLCVPVFAITNTVFSDIDGDGDLDVYLETILQNNGSMTFIIRNLTNTSGIVTIPGVTRGYFADVTGDGLEDLYIVRAGAQNFLYIRNGSASFYNATGTSLGANLTGNVVSSAGAAFADFDNDGDVDVYANGQFFVTTTYFAAINGTNSSNLDELPVLDEVVPVDVNLDGLVDFVGVTSAGNVRVMLNLGDSNGDLVPEFYDSTTDVQLDAIPSVNTAALTNVQSGIAVNQSLGYFPFNGVSTPFMVDNFTDVYLGVSGRNQLLVQLFPSTPRTFFGANSSQFYLPRFLNASQAPVDDSGSSTSVVLADFDNNDFTDVLIGNAAGGSGVYLRNGSSWNQSYLNASLNASNITNFKYAAVRDLDGDGFLDVAVIDDQYILDGGVVAGSSSFDVTGAPGGSVDPSGDGLSNSDVFSDLLLSSQLENIVFSNDNPFSVFIDAVEVFLLPDTGQALVSGGSYSNTYALLVDDPGPEPPVPPVSSVGGGGGGGGGYARINQFLVVDKVTVNNMGQTFVIPGLTFGDELRVSGPIIASVQFDGYVVATNPDKGRIMKAQQVLVQMGNLQQYVMTDENGRFSALFPDLRNLVLGDQGQNLPIWFTPNLADSPETRRIGNTYQPYYKENPTFNFISPAPGLGVEYPFVPGVWFNDVLVEPVKVYAPVESPAVVEPEAPVVVPEVPVVGLVERPVVEKPELGFFAKIGKFFSDIFVAIGRFIGVIPEPVIPGPSIFPEDEVPPEEPKTSISLPPPPESPLGCDLSCQHKGRNAIFTYTPQGCGVDFIADCNYEYTGGTSTFNDYVNSQLDVCCSLPDVVEVPIPPPEGPSSEPVPPAEGFNCKLSCEYQAPSAVFKYSPVGDLECKEDFKVSCGETSGGPGSYSGHEGLSPGELLWVNTYLKECCEGTTPPALTGKEDDFPPVIPLEELNETEIPKCEEKRIPYCKVEALWLTGGLGSKKLRNEVYAVHVIPTPNPPCGEPYEDDLQAGDDITGIDCIQVDYCGTASRYACVDGGGAFRQDSGEVGPQCADGADGDNGGAGTFPCDPCTDQQFFACGSVVENAYFIGGAGGGLSGSMPVDAPLQAIVGQANYDECCGTGGTAPSLYVAECSTTSSQSSCQYYDSYKGAGLPFFRTNTIETSGSTCAEESSETNYEQCVCADMLYQYGACNSVELNSRALVSYEASLVRATCCPSALTTVPPPREVPIAVTPPPVSPPPTTPPPPTVPPPPAVDVCTPVGDRVGIETDIISGEEQSRVAVESVTGVFPESFVPDDYDLIESVRVNACEARDISFQRSISNQYQDVRVFRCQNGVCSWVTERTESDLTCNGESLERILSGDVSRVLEVDQMEVITSVGEEVTTSDRLISTGRYSVEFTGDLPSGIVRLGRPDGRITLPRNLGLQLVGTPLVITVESAPNRVVVTLPVTPIETATSYSIFGLIGSSWIEVGGDYDPSAGTIITEVNDFNNFVRNNKAVFAVMAYTSHEKSDSCVMMREGNNDELIVLVHGFTSNKNTWKPFVTQAELNKEPYDIVAFQYSPEQTTDQAAQSLMSCLSTVAGNYKRYNIVAHSVGAVIANKALGKMNENPDAYPTIYTVEKVISLGMPNEGIDVFVMNRLADVLANYPTLATVFDRRSVIAQELVNPTWDNLTTTPEWAQHIGVAGTVECDFSQMLTDVTERPAAGGAFSIIDPIQRFTRANDCVVTVKNALEHIPNQELCSNTFTPNVWHIALNDDSKVRQLIFYLINQEKAKADPTRGFAGYNQYISWVDSCAPGTIYGVVGKKATAQKPLFCNCGDGVCDATIGETENSCPIDCYGWNMFACTLLKNLSNLLLLLFGAGFITYFTRKHVMNKQVNEKRWKIVLWGTFGTVAAMLIIAAMLCPTVPVAGLLLTVLLGGLLLAENTLSRTPPSKPLSGQKAQVSLESEAKLNEWEKRYEELKRRESVLKKFKV
jgi:pimeloyl-ACP methyl ester carboxylesterase